MAARRRRVTPPREATGLAEKILTSRGGGAAALLIGGVATLMATLDVLGGFESRVDDKLLAMRAEINPLKNEVVTMRYKVDTLPNAVEKNRDALRELEREKLPALEATLVEQMAFRTSDRFTNTSARELDKRYQQSLAALEKRLDGLERRLERLEAGHSKR